MSVTFTQENEGPSSAHTVPEQAEASALDRRIEQMLEAEMAKGFLASFHDDFAKLMQRLDSRLAEQNAAMDSLLRRLSKTS